MLPLKAEVKCSSVATGGHRRRPWRPCHGGARFGNAAYLELVWFRESGGSVQGCSQSFGRDGGGCGAAASSSELGGPMASAVCCCASVVNGEGDGG